MEKRESLIKTMTKKQLREMGKRGRSQVALGQSLGTRIFPAANSYVRMKKREELRKMVSEVG